MENLESLIDEIKLKIFKKFQEQKTELFLSNGTIYGRSWKDLSPDYKKWKQNEIGRIYPMNILYGTMLKSLIEQSLRIETDYSEEELRINVNIDSIRMNLDGPDGINVQEYTDAMNEQREFILFSSEEKEELVKIAYETINEHFGEL